MNSRLIIIMSMDHVGHVCANLRGWRDFYALWYQNYLKALFKWIALRFFTIESYEFIKHQKLVESFYKMKDYQKLLILEYYIKIIDSWKLPEIQFFIWKL